MHKHVFSLCWRLVSSAKARHTAVPKLRDREACSARQGARARVWMCYWCEWRGGKALHTQAVSSSSPLALTLLTCPLEGNSNWATARWGHRKIKSREGRPPKDVPGRNVISKEATRGFPGMLDFRPRHFHNFLSLYCSPLPVTLRIFSSEGGVRFPVPGIWVGWWLASANPSHHGLCMLLFSPCHQHENKPRLAGWKMRRPRGAESLLKPLLVSQGAADPPAGGRQECAQITDCATAAYTGGNNTRMLVFNWSIVVYNVLVSAAQQSDSDIYIFFMYINIHSYIYIYNYIYSFFFWYSFPWWFIIGYWI